MRGWFRSLRWKRRQAPAKIAPLSLPDALVASRAGLTESDWRALDDRDRATYRLRIGAYAVTEARK